MSIRAVSQLSPMGIDQLLWSLIAANMNSTADQSMVKAFPFATYQISRIVVSNASTSLTLAAGGIYTGAAKSGNAVVAAAQLYSGLTGATLGIAATLAAVGLAVQSATTLFLSLTTAQGGAATADFRVYGTPLT